MDANPLHEKHGFVHVVYFWLIDQISEEQKRYFESELEKLGQTPTIKQYRWGTPAKSAREVVDDSFDYSWIVHFEDRAAEEIYQEHPIHLAFVENCAPLFKKVIVYDSHLH